MGRKIKPKPILIIKDKSIRRAIVQDQKNEVKFVGSAVDETFGDITVSEQEPVRRHARVPKSVEFDHIEGGQFIITRKDRKDDLISQTAILIQPNLEKEVFKLEVREQIKKGELNNKSRRDKLRNTARKLGLGFQSSTLTPQQLFNRIEKAV